LKRNTAAASSKKKCRSKFNSHTDEAKANMPERNKVLLKKYLTGILDRMGVTQFGKRHFSQM
jgi:hypothetical protein